MGPEGAPGPAGPAGPGCGDCSGCGGTTPPKKYVGQLVIDGLNTPTEPSLLFAVRVGVKNSGASGTGGGGGAGKAEFEDFGVLKPVDELSPKLMLATANGKHFTKGTIEIFGDDGPGGAPILTWELTDVLVSALDFSASGDAPSDSVTLSFSKVCSIYTGLDSGGKPANVKECWDIKQNKEP